MNLLEFFNLYSKIDFSKIITLFLDNKEEFTNSLTSLDENTKFIVLKPIHEVYKAISSNKEEFDKIKNSLLKSFHLVGNKTNTSKILNSNSFIELQIKNFIENVSNQSNISN